MPSFKRRWGEKCVGLHTGFLRTFLGYYLFHVHVDGGWVTSSVPGLTLVVICEYRPGITVVYVFIVHFRKHKDQYR